MSEDPAKYEGQSYADGFAAGKLQVPEIKIEALRAAARIIASRPLWMHTHTDKDGVTGVLCESAEKATTGLADQFAAWLEGR